MRSPAFFIGAAPVFRCLGIVLDVAVAGVDVEFAVDEVGDVGELQVGDADVAGLDGLVELLFAADASDKVCEVQVGHAVFAGEVGRSCGLALQELSGLASLEVVEFVTAGVDHDGAGGSDDEVAAIAAVKFHTVAALAFPLDELVIVVDEAGVEGVVELPVVLVGIAAAGGGDAVGEGDTHDPARDVGLVSAVIEGLAGAVAAQPMPVVGVDVVFVFTARDGSLPEIPVEGSGDGNWLADSHRFACIAVPALGVVGAADEAILNFFDEVDVDGRGAALCAHLDALVVLFLGFDEESAFGRVVAAGLFDVDVLAGAEAIDGERRVPMVGRRDGDGVDVLGGEHLAEVFVGFGGIAQVALQTSGEALEDDAIDIADMRDAHVILVGFESGEMGVGAAVEADDREVDAVIGSEYLGIAFCCWSNGSSGCGNSEAVEKGTSRDHCFSLPVGNVDNVRMGGANHGIPYTRLLVVSSNQRSIFSG